MLLGVLFLFGLGLGARIVAQRLGIAQRQVEAEVLHRRCEMLGQIGGDVQLATAGLADDEAARMQMHLAADAAGKKRVLPAIFAIAQDRVADRGQMDAQLVGPARQRLQFEPCGLVARPLDHAVACLGGLAALHVDMHLLAAGARLLGERGVDQTHVLLRHADHQRPVDLLGAAAREALGKCRRAARCARDQQHAAGILVEPVDEARAGFVTLHEGIEQPVDMAVGLAAPLGGEAGRLVEDDRGLGLLDHHRARLLALFLGQLAAAGRGLGLGRVAGRDAQHLPCHQPVVGLGAGAIDPDLPGPRPARDSGKAHFRQVPLEPAVEPDAVVILAHGVLPHLSLGGALGRCVVLFVVAHRPTRPA